MESGGWLVNQCLARSLSDNGNSRSMRASSVTMLYLTVSQTSIKLVKCAFGFSVGNPWNWMLLSICKVTPFNSKLFAYIGGRRIVDLTTIGGKENSSSSICGLSGCTKGVVAGFL